MKAIAIDRFKDRGFAEEGFALKLALLLYFGAMLAPRRGKGLGISLPPGPGEGGCILLDKLKNANESEFSLLHLIFTISLPAAGLLAWINKVNKAKLLFVQLVSVD